METLAIIGAGIMGSGIAQVCGQNGLDVNLVDVNDEIIAEGIGAIRDSLDRLANKGEISVESVNETLRRIHRFTDLAGLDTVLYVLEYMHEKLGEKYRPCPLLQQMVNEGRHGRKTGKGVFKYEMTE